MRKVLFVLAALGLMTAGTAGTIEIINDTGGWDIWNIYISPTTRASWGDNWLGTEILDSDESIIFDVPDDDYDIKLIDEDDDEYIRYGVGIYDYYTWSVTLDDLGSYDMGGSGTVYGSTQVTIYNDTGGYYIWDIYCSPSSSPDWGEDHLGSEILSDSEEYTFWVEGGDYYDIQCVDEVDDTYTFWYVWVGVDGLYLPVDLGDLD